MKPAADQPTTKSRSGKPQLKLGGIGMQLLDTTWRIAVPVLLCAGVGIFIDRAWGSKPWVTLLGTVIGFVVAGMLVKRLIDEVEREENR